MDTRIGTTQPSSTVGNAVPARSARERDAQPERRFVLPRREAEDDDAESADEHGVLEPQPRRDVGDKPVSRALLEDEAGQRIDVRG